MQKAPAKKQMGITQQEERMEEAPAKEHTEGGSAIKSTVKNPLKGDHGKNPPKESTEISFGKKKKRKCIKRLQKANGRNPSKQAHGKFRGRGHGRSPSARELTKKAQRTN